MLGRILQPLPLRTSRRAYSFFSSKPGGGRYFNSTKPHKVTPKTDAGTGATSPAEDPSSNTLPHEEQPSPPQPQPPLLSSSTSAPPRLPPHPSFSNHTYPLHQFFASHRPLLLLPLPTSTLFDTPTASFDDASTAAPAEGGTPPLLGEFPDAQAHPDADADAARQLARALAMNRVGAWIDWEETLARLGDVQSADALQTTIPVFAVEMDSTKRKRRKKMSKHKYKKRRRLQRSERRKMGK